MADSWEIWLQVNEHLTQVSNVIITLSSLLGGIIAHAMLIADWRRPSNDEAKLSNLSRCLLAAFCVLTYGIALRVGPWIFGIFFAADGKNYADSVNLFRSLFTVPAAVAITWGATKFIKEIRGYSNGWKYSVVLAFIMVGVLLVLAKMNGCCRGAS